MSPLPIPPRIREALRLLCSVEIRFVVVGGVAIILHGGDTPTYDMDISFALDAENRRRLVSLLNAHHPRPLGFPADRPFILDADVLAQVRFLNLVTDLGELDLLPLPAGVDSFEGLWDRAVPMDLEEGCTVRVAALDDLIAMKKAAGRPKDRLHLLELWALKRLTGEDL